MSGAPPFICAKDVEPKLNWRSVVKALKSGCRRPRAPLGDLLLERPEGGLLNRAAWVDGFGYGVKAVTIYPDNTRADPPRPAVQGIFILFDAETGAVKSIIDGALVTKWKTAADSVLGAQLLARPRPRRLFVMGAGAVARSLIDAYAAMFPTLERIEIWARDAAKAQALANEAASRGKNAGVVENPADAANRADIIATATAARAPILRGDWIAPGAHVDLVGAYRPTTREADDALLRKARIFVDCRETTLDHIGELKIPLATGVISLEDIGGDLYDLIAGAKGRIAPDDVTVFKNGGGAHFDVMTADVIYRLWRAANKSAKHDFSG